MSRLENSRFLKMNGLGNKIVVLDLRGSSLIVTEQEARAIAAEKSSAFDQMMVLHTSANPEVHAFMRIYNTDGSEAEGCGNGTRCVAWAMMSDPKMGAGFSGGTSLLLETKTGPLVCERKGEFAFTVDMGQPRFGWREIPLGREVEDTSAFNIPLEGHDLGPASAVSMGNPHVIFRVKDVATCGIEVIGPLVENHPMFPQRTNVSFAEFLSKDHIRLRVWERGVGETQACGTATCATAVNSCRLGLTGRDVTVTLPGGDLAIHWRESDNHVLMTGPVELEWEGRFTPELFARRD